MGQVLKVKKEQKVNRVSRVLSEEQDRSVQKAQLDHEARGET